MKNKKQVSAATPATRELTWYLGVGLIALNILFILLIDIFPFQDMPQHLTYAKILAEFFDQGSIFPSLYELPKSFVSYHSFHWALAGFSRFVGVEWGLKIIVLFYALLLFLGIKNLIDQLYPQEQNHWRYFFIQFAVWNATIGMGFMPFVISMPFFVSAIAYFMRLGSQPENKRNWIFYLGSLLFSSLTHVVTGLFIVTFLMIYSVFKKSKRTWAISIGTLLYFLLAGFLFGGFGKNDGNLLAHQSVNFWDAYQSSYGFEFITAFFRAEWSPLPVLANYILWNFIGPYRLGTLLFLAAIYGTFIFFLSRGNGSPNSTLKPDSQLLIFKRSALVFLIFSLAVPWGIYVPSEITFLNYRLLSLALFLLLPLVPSCWGANPGKRNVVASMCLFSMLFYFCMTGLYQSETKTPLKMMAKLPAQKTMGSLMFGNKSSYFAKILDLTHFMPMFYTIRFGGINNQFWARYAPHLPVGYRSGVKIAGTPDWHPWKFKAEDIEGLDYFLLQSSLSTSGQSEISVKSFLTSRMTLMECQQNWCLYRRR